MKTVVEPSFTATVYVAGDYQKARDSLRRQCMEEGLCVTLTPTTFVYTAGVEDGVAVGLVNYPRIPKSPDAILARALAVADFLMVDLYQWSALVVTPTETVWRTRRPEDLK